ncbi:MAG: mannonate dehydratase [Bryobacterales bacterium]|nr:mannonate dehydratase [Bryobacterales bacterium]
MIDVTNLPMRVGLGQFQKVTESRLRFIKQCGCDDFQINTPALPGKERWEYEDLATLVSQAERADLRLIAIENVPRHFYDRIMLGQPGREKQLDNMIWTVRNIARAGIPYLGYNFMPGGVWRTSQDTPVRGGALATSFRLSTARTVGAGNQAQYAIWAGAPTDREYSEEEIWENYSWFMERILPVCEEVGLRLALHPDDPPVPTLGGIGRVFRNFDNFRRAMETFDSPMHGLDFCHGCWSEMRAGKGVTDAIRYFGERGKIFYVHFRDVQGPVEDFTECYLGDGNCNPVESIRALKQVGFRGFVIPDHVPRMVGDGSWCHRGRAWTVGYIQALIAAVAA